MASFRGIEFDEIGSSGEFEVWSRAATVDAVVIPSSTGGRTVYQVGTRGVRSLSKQISCTRSQLEALLNSTGLSGSLVLDYDSGDALLLSVENARLFMANTDIYVATCTFVRP